MKKILFSFILFTVCTLINAQNVKVEIEAAKAQAGSTTTLNVMLTTDVDLAGLTFYVKLPSSAVVTPVDNDGTSEPNITFVKSGTAIASFESDGRLSYGIMSASNIFTASAEPVKIATIEVKAPEAISTYPMVVSRIGYANSDGTVDVLPTEGVTYETDLAVQKAAVIEPQDPNYSFEIVPFVTEAGKTYTSSADNSIAVPVILNNADFVSEAKFDLTLPEGFAVASYKSGMKTTTKKPEVVTSRSYNVSEGGNSELVVNQTASGSVVTYALSSTGDGDFVMNEGSGELCKIYLTTASTVAPGVYTLKINNISITSTPDGEEMTTHVGGEYLASVIVGQPAAQEAILYGNYSSTVASTFSTALKNVATVDVTAATVAEDVKFQDVLVNEKGGNSYYTRTSANYGTTVLPLDLTSGELYEITDMSSKSITIKETDVVAANTPCIFKGTINVAGGTPSLGAINNQSIASTTFKGTYEATTIADGAGYYIAADGKFYSDGASIAPFRAYFEGTISGVKEFRVNLETPNGLIDITDQFSSEDIYNLQGIRVQNAKKGVNIVGGKKVYVK